MLMNDAIYDDCGYVLPLQLLLQDWCAICFSTRRSSNRWTLAMTAGYCGTLLTPMAGNFNVLPVALLEMEDEYGVIAPKSL